MNSAKSIVQDYLRQLKSFYTDEQSLLPTAPARPQFSIADSQQVLPLAKAHALGDLKRRDDAAFDLLARLSGALAN
jgi:hypothetical protein